MINRDTKILTEGTLKLALIVTPKGTSFYSLDSCFYPARCTTIYLFNDRGRNYLRSNPMPNP